jgi:hypothetical protein
MPSYLESLSMVALEAWAMGNPVLANAKCDVLQGQCLRSNAGLFYDNYPEFAETLRAIDTTPSLQAALGRNGRAFFERHYAWPVVVKKYTDMLEELSKGSASVPMEALPGWFARRRRTLPPADSIVTQLPSGPWREARAGAPRATVGTPPPQMRPPRPEGRPPLAEGRTPIADSRGPRAEGRPPRADSRPPTDQRRGRHHRRGRRPGGGGGGR